jgi:hypothetical protein
MRRLVHLSHQAGEEQAIRYANTPQTIWEEKQPNVVISRSERLPTLWPGL